MALHPACSPELWTRKEGSCLQGLNSCCITEQAILTQRSIQDEGERSSEKTATAPIVTYSTRKPDCSLVISQKRRIIECSVPKLECLMINVMRPKKNKRSIVTVCLSLLGASGFLVGSAQSPETHVAPYSIAQPGETFTMPADTPTCVVQAIGACLVSSQSERDRCFVALEPLCSQVPAIESHLCALEYQACATRYERRVRSQCPALHFEPCN